MGDQEHFWRLGHLSDRQILERLQGVLRAQRCSLAELVAHLGEVEERRLHLAAAYGSLFSYCVQCLGMSEDEACRRIELARLARKFPALVGELASGRISLSVALLLKPVLAPDNHAEWFAAVRGASLRTARELLAARFPRPDVPSSIRKLPERVSATAIPAATVAPAGPALVAGLAPTPQQGPHSSHQTAVTDITSATRQQGLQFPSAAAAGATHALRSTVDAISTAAGEVVAGSITTAGGATGTAAAAVGPAAPQLSRGAELDLGSRAAVGAESWRQAPPSPPQPSPAPVPGLPRHAARRQRVEPLSAARYRVQFTADVSLKQKLELARDLLRHAHPSGDLGPIVARALDLLLQQLLERRFGARRKGDASRRSASTASRTAAAGSAAADAAPTPASAASTTAKPSPAPATSHIACAARREVLERDGLGCAWVDATGKRCCSTAWLELDHQHPSGKGGDSGPGNLRWLCRAHNRFAAERAYGREHVERAIQARQRVAPFPPCSSRGARLVDADGAGAVELAPGVDTFGPAGSTES